MDSAAKRQKKFGAYDWKLTPIPKVDSGKAKGTGKGAGKGPGNPAVESVPVGAKTAASNLLSQKGAKGAPQAKSALTDKALGQGKGTAGAPETISQARTASAKFSPASKAGAPIGKSVSQAVPKSAATFSAPKSAPAPAVKGAVESKGVGKGKSQPDASNQGKAAGIVPTIAKAKAKAQETARKGSTPTPLVAAQVKGKGKGGKPMQTGKPVIPNRACRCGNNVAEEYWQALESKETYCSICWEKIQARSPNNPTFGMLLGLEAMRDLGVQLPIAV